MPIPGDTPFPVKFSIPSEDALTHLLPTLYGFGTPCTCRLHRQGICDTYRVDTPGAGYFLKVYRHGRRSLKDVTEEVRLLNHLLAEGVPVVEPVPMVDGGYVHTLQAPEGVRHCVLFHAVDGVGENSDKHSRGFGAAVAHMHVASDRMSPPYDRQHLDMGDWLEGYMVPIRALMAHRPTDLDLIKRIVDCTARGINGLLSRETPEYGVCHGDLHGGDVLYDAKGNPTLLDFDNSGCGWRAVDIGTYLCHDWMNTTQRAERVRRRKLGAFLDGYRTIRELGDNEHKAIELAPPIRHVFLMGHVLLHTTVTDGWNWANDGFIDWHMAWFRHWRENNMK